VQNIPGSIALTGGTGFIGQHLISALLRDGFNVKALTRKPNALPENINLQQITGVLEDQLALVDLVSGTNAVIHVGGRIAGRNLREFESANILGTENLIRAATDQPDGPKLIYISTLAAREPHLSHYATTKKEGEIRFQALSAPNNWQILRPPVVYGPGDKQMLKLFKQFKNGFALRPKTSGRFSMIYVEDLVSAIMYLLKSSPQKPAIFELDDGHPNGYSWNEVVAEASQKLERNIRSFDVPTALLHLVGGFETIVSSITNTPPTLSRGKINEFTHPDWVATTNLLNNVSDWESNVNLQEGISRTIDWYVSRRWL